jgi:hypothetical protein
MQENYVVENMNFGKKKLSMCLNVNEKCYVTPEVFLI